MQKLGVTNSPISLMNDSLYFVENNVKHIGILHSNKNTYYYLVTSN